MNAVQVLDQLNANDQARARNAPAWHAKPKPETIIVAGWDFKREVWAAYPIGQDRDKDTIYCFMVLGRWYTGTAGATMEDKPYVGVWRKATRAERLKAGAW